MDKQGGKTGLQQNGKAEMAVDRSDYTPVGIGAPHGLGGLGARQRALAIDVARSMQRVTHLHHIRHGIGRASMVSF